MVSHLEIGFQLVCLSVPNIGAVKERAEKEEDEDREDSERMCW